MDNSALSKQKENNKIKQQVLIQIPEAHALIYPTHLTVGRVAFHQLQTTDTGEEISISDAHSSPDKSPTKNQPKIISFNDPDLAFNVIEERKLIQIHNLTKNLRQCELRVKQQSTLLTIQSLLRKKMCEMGFERRYEKLKVLGSGATAQVYLVSRKCDGKRFAAKIISLKESSDKAYDSFINQAKLLRIIKHKNIVHLESLYIEKKQLIEVLEYLDGGTLLHALRKNEIKMQNQKWLVLKDITEALDHLRQKRLIHRDLKLENILIRQGPVRKQYVLSDFGLACWSGEKSLLFERCGTPGYIAPEVLLAPKGVPFLDHRIDIFSLGVIAHLVFLLQPLFQYNGKIKDLLKANKKAEYSLHDPLYNDISLNSYQFLEMTLAKNVNQRATSSLLLAKMEGFVVQTPRKSREKTGSQQKISRMGLMAMGVDTKIKKSPSLTKRNISLNIPKQSSPQKNRSNSAKKFFENIWSSFVTPTKTSSNLKVKENSVQKHKKLKDFFN